VLDVAALAVIALTSLAVPVQRGDLAEFAFLAMAAVLHMEATRRAERIRELATEGVPYVSLKAIWTFAGLLVLPPLLVAILIGITYWYSWVRSGKAIVLHHTIASASTIVIASAAAGSLLALTYPDSYPSLIFGWLGVALVVMAAFARWAVNSLLVLVAMPLMNTATTWRQAWRAVFGTPRDDLIEFTALSLGAAVAMMLTFDAPYVLVLCPLIVAVHRSVQLGQFEVAVQRDRDTGALRPELWHELASKQIERAARLHEGVGYLFVRLDEVDARLAELPEARLGRLVAEAIASEVREGDLVGRLHGGLDFAVLVVDVTDQELAKIADRIRARVQSAEIPPGGSVDRATSGLTVSIGGASYPVAASTLPDLMTCADNALFLAKSYLRNEVVIVGPDTPTTTR
jgi:diguanylate cyclase (GGDEF)-like protein